MVDKVKGDAVKVTKLDLFGRAGHDIDLVVDAVNTDDYTLVITEDYGYGSPSVEVFYFNVEKAKVF